MIYAIDFDGTLCKSAWPKIGEPRMRVIKRVKRLRRKGHRLILWTCREGEMLQRALRWCNIYGIIFDAVNENLASQTKLYGNDCRKIGADFYIDDKSKRW
jgi:hydroxymethylpyrimidine pyrophosphatase-like HAD family hydrolase